MSDFKVGQKVWAFTYGWGVVQDIDYYDSALDYPINVKFGADDVICFTRDGRYTTDENRTLFFKEIQIPEDALVPPIEEIVLGIGDIVLFENGQLCYVSEHSDASEKLFHYNVNVPMRLDDAYSSTIGFKKSIKKVVGNINA